MKEEIKAKKSDQILLHHVSISREIEKNIILVFVNDYFHIYFSLKLKQLN